MPLPTVTNKITAAQLKYILGMSDTVFTGPTTTKTRNNWIGLVVGREIKHPNELLKSEASKVIGELKPIYDQKRFEDQKVYACKDEASIEDTY